VCVYFFISFAGHSFAADMEKMHQWMLVVFVCCITLPALLSEKCFSRSQKTHLHLATKTPYRYLANKNDSLVHYPGKILNFVILNIPISKLTAHILLSFSCCRL
jgi:hypothetical protein